jgi:beta-1,4-mannooligosaccharide/beta-1,4-mannosyl-N-acetylglucosamine phosphorylase
MCRDPLLAPEEAYPYEMDGFRGSVIFPCGLIVEDDGEAKLYYGAADTVVALATAKLGDLIDLCKPV